MQSPLSPVGWLFAALVVAALIPAIMVFGWVLGVGFTAILGAAALTAHWRMRN